MFDMKITLSTFDTPSTEPLVSVPDYPENPTERPIPPVVNDVTSSGEAAMLRPAKAKTESPKLKPTWVLIIYTIMLTRLLLMVRN